ncbi:hypothetical protein [Henriciella litoralis]|uniref:hypothetical protein n=1 Tax=Henriciella litoralis TaxID=568102 RepID=UPI000A03A674|nr:hypothetical protein [Henriciella litoralis]
MYRPIGLVSAGAILSVILGACSDSAATDHATAAVEADGPDEAVLIKASAEQGETIGLAFSYFWYNNYETPDDCPEGLSYALRDIAIMNLPKEKQEFLLKAENRSTYYKMGYALSAKRHREQGTSICNVPLAYDDPPLRTVQTDIAYGRDLDGATSNGSDDDSCGTVDFTSPDGREGIDNEMWRIMGCIDSYRRTAEFAGGAFEDYHTGAYRDGEVTTIMEITGVDDRQNDDYVEVGVYSSHEPTPYDAEKNGIGYASLTVTPNKLWHNTTTGRIVDGELITEPFDLRLKFGFTGRAAEYYIKRTQIHLTLNEDGTASGDLAGYQDLNHAYWHNFHDKSGAFQVANGYTCASAWRALEAHADGIKDPETGKCTGISTALKIEAVPAFVIHPPEEELEFYVMDTSDYYGVAPETLKVAGAEFRPLTTRGLGADAADGKADADADENKPEDL